MLKLTHSSTLKVSHSARSVDQVDTGIQKALENSQNNHIFEGIKSTGA